MNDEEEDQGVGRESRAKVEEAIRVLNVTIGPAQPFDVHRGQGCPKCGAKSEQFLKRWCPGSEKAGVEGTCREFGEHLHTLCQTCQYQWREECADAEANRERLEELSRAEAATP